jgi:hypothetical protein
MLMPVAGGLLVPAGVAPQPGLTQPIFRMVLKGGIAYLIAWAGENMMGRRAFEPVFLGGAVEVIHDFVRTFFAPAMPILAGDDRLAAWPYPLEALPYPEEVEYPFAGVYPDLGDERDELDEIDEVVEPDEIIV